MKVVDAQKRAYGKDGYNGNRREREYNSTLWLSGSCGARYEANPTAKTDLRRIHNGIKIVKGHIQENMVTPAYTITQLNTKAGPITVGIRKKTHV